MTVNKMHPFRLLFLVVAVLLAGVQAAAAASLHTAVARFTDTQDGRAAYVRAVETHFGAANDGGAGEARVLRLLAPLTEAAKMERPLVVVTARDDVNAYALPGMIVVHRGLLALVTDDGELSVLLAHELGHLAQGHPVRGIRRSMRAQYFARRAAKAKNLDDGANDFVQAALHADVGLHEERKADEWAAALLPRAGITPAVAVGLWDHLASASIPDEPRAHPSYEERKRIYGNARKEQRNDP